MRIGTSTVQTGGTKVTIASQLPKCTQKQACINIGNVQTGMYYESMLLQIVSLQIDKQLFVHIFDM